MLAHPDQGLTWKFVTLGGDVVSDQAFPNTEVALMSGKGKHQEEASLLPVYRRYKILEGVTKEKYLGHGYRDTTLNLIHDDPNDE